jgi:hypothetical protein
MTKNYKLIKSNTAVFAMLGLLSPSAMATGRLFKDKWYCNAPVLGTIFKDISSVCDAHKTKDPKNDNRDNQVANLDNNQGVNPEIKSQPVRLETQEEREARITEEEFSFKKEVYRRTFGGRYRNYYYKLERLKERFDHVKNLVLDDEKSISGDIIDTQANLKNNSEEEIIKKLSEIENKISKLEERKKKNDFINKVKNNLDQPLKFLLDSPIKDSIDVNLSLDIDTLLSSTTVGEKEVNKFNALLVSINKSQKKLEEFNQLKNEKENDPVKKNLLDEFNDYYEIPKARVEYSPGERRKSLTYLAAIFKELKQTELSYLIGLNDLIIAEKNSKIKYILKDEIKLVSNIVNNSICFDLLSKYDCDSFFRMDIFGSLNLELNLFEWRNKVNALELVNIIEKMNDEYFSNDDKFLNPYREFTKHYKEKIFIKNINTADIIGQIEDNASQEETMKKNSEYQKIEGYRISPIQRGPRYELLFSSVLKELDKLKDIEGLEAVKIAVKNVLNTIKEKMDLINDFNNK